MNYSEAGEACDLIAMLAFIKLCRRDTPYSGNKLNLKSHTSGTPEFGLRLDVQEIILNSMEDYAMARLTELAVEPDKEGEDNADPP